LQHGAKGFKGIGLDFIDYGYNYRFTELQSVMGIKQLKKIESIIKDRNQIRLVYIKNLFKLGFVPQKIFKNVFFNNQTVAFKVSNRQLRDGLIKFLKRNEIETTIGYYSLSNTTYYKKKYNSQQKNSNHLISHRFVMCNISGCKYTYKEMNLFLESVILILHSIFWLIFLNSFNQLSFW
jgi:dTDP-4-amino-4,6-dideoxygalactose transaminase